MPGPRRRGRSDRAVRTVSVLAGFGVMVTLVAAGTPGGAGDDPASVPEAAAAAEPSPTASAGPSPGATPTADPLAAPASASSASPSPAPPAAKAVDTLATAGARARKITDKTKDWASLTLLDRKTGKVVGDGRSTQVTSTESTVKAWLAADLLATRGRQGISLTAYETARMTAMIRESDDNAAAVIWRWLGADAAIRDMITTCRLQDTTVYPAWWSRPRSRPGTWPGSATASSRGRASSCPRRSGRRW